MYKYESFYFDNPIEKGRAIDIFLPEKNDKNHSIFFVHGGGWSGGSRLGYHNIMHAFNQKGYICATVDYRLINQGQTIPEMVMDIRHGFQFFRRYLAEHNFSQGITVFGSSAGAHLAALMSFSQPGECGDSLQYKKMEINPKEWQAPTSVVLQATPTRFEPWDEIFPPIWSAMLEAAGKPYEGNEAYFQKLAPLSFVNKDTPQTYFMEASDEHMFPHRFILEFIEKMKKYKRKSSYKIYQNAEHGFFYALGRKIQKEAFLDFLDYLDHVR